MTGWKQWAAPLTVLLLVLVAISWLFQVRLGGGDIYPPYSSLRADALGTRALYEALEHLDGMHVERDYHPLEKLGTQPRLLVFSGLDWDEWKSVRADHLSAINAAANHGARVILAFQADLISDKDSVTPDKPVPKKTEPTEKEKKAEADKEAKKTKSQLLRQKQREPKELAKEWSLTFKQRSLATKDKDARRSALAPTELPAQVAWHSDVYFAVTADSGWRVLYRRAGEAVMVEKTVGQGSIVIMADAYCLSNEAMQRDRATALLSYLVADQKHVAFVESTLGVLEDNGVGFLARRYGLGGALALCVLLGALYAWRRLVAFLPTQELDNANHETALAYEPAAGFTGLLRRSLNAADVLPACIAEWQKAQRSGGNATAQSRIAAAWQTRDPKAPLTETYNMLVRILKPR